MAYQGIYKLFDAPCKFFCPGLTLKLTGYNQSMKRSQFMIMDYPQLVKYFASKNPIQLLLFITPLWIFFGLNMVRSSGDAGLMILSFLTGIFYWSFLEYVIHRFGYHTPYKSKLVYYFLGSFHLYHHKDMSDHRILNAGFLMIYVLTPTVLLPFLLITQEVSYLSSLGLGLTMAYYFYEWVHYILHYKVHSYGYLNYIQKFHFHHHDKAPHMNFGNTSHFWDYLLGTYDPQYKTYQMPAKSEATLITSVEAVHAKV